MAKKKKKKKRPMGARKPTYARGKRVEEPSGAGKAGAGQAAKDAPVRAKQSTATGERSSWNLVRSGTLEAKVMWALLAIAVVSALFSYPITEAEANTQYRNSVREHTKALKEWNEKYRTEAERKKHADEKPARPRRPTTGVILISILFSALQSAIFAFIGLNIARRTDLGTPVLDAAFSKSGVERSSLAPFLTWSLPAGLLMLVPLYLNARISSDIVNNVLRAGEISGAKYPMWKQFLGSFSNSLFFQMLFVLLFFSSMVWLFTRYREQVRLEPHWAGLVAASLVTFGFIMLNVSTGTGAAAEKLTYGTQAAYALTLAAPVPLLGYVFWKKGLEYSLLAGVTGFGLYPFMASLIIK